MIKENNLVFKLDTKNTSYSFRVMNNGRIEHLYYGKRVSNDDLSFMHDDNAFRSFCPYVEGDKPSNSQAITLNEFAGFNTGDMRSPAVCVEHQFGTCETDYVYYDYEIINEFSQDIKMPQARKQGSKTLRLGLIDPTSRCKVDIFYTVYFDYDVITRITKMTNTGNTPVTIKKLMSGMVDFNDDDFELYHLSGVHANEFRLNKTKLCQGKISISSVQGFTSHLANPAIMLANEEKGDFYAFNLVYSGNFLVEIESNPYHNARVLCGINNLNFSWKLQPNDTFFAPEAIMAYGCSLDDIVKIQHSFIKDKIVKELPKNFTAPPILFNTWEANYMDISASIVEEYLHIAKTLGVDTLVVDDGWFENRSNDTDGLGMWTIDKNKFPDGLKPVAQKVNAEGLRFGIWIEPEMVNPNVEILKTHPDWAIQIPNRKRSLSRDQLVFDLSNDDIIDYLVERFIKAFDGVNVEYIKWDANRYLTEVGSLNLSADRQGEVSHRYMLGVYKLYSRLQQAFPNVFFEGCSGGGGRFDLGMLCYNPTIWSSDNVDPFERSITQYGLNHFYPAACSAVHFSHDRGNLNRVASIKFRYAICLLGAMGIEFDIKKLSKEERNELFNCIQDYRELSPLVLKGDYYCLRKPQSNKFSFEFVSKDKKQALVVYCVLSGQSNVAPEIVKFKGLDNDLTYKIDGDISLELKGDTLLNCGIPMYCGWNDGATVILKLMAK